jgi:hypothetical protein
LGWRGSSSWHSVLSGVGCLSWQVIQCGVSKLVPASVSSIELARGHSSFRAGVGSIQPACCRSRPACCRSSWRGHSSWRAVRTMRRRWGCLLVVRLGGCGHSSTSPRHLTLRLWDPCLRVVRQKDADFHVFRHGGIGFECLCVVRQGGVGDCSRSSFGSKGGP